MYKFNNILKKFKNPDTFILDFSTVVNSLS